MQNLIKKKIQFPRSFSSFIIHPMVLALPFALLIFFLLPIEFEKFKVELIRENISQLPRYFKDLNYDGISEEVILRYDDIINKTNSNIQIRTPAIDGLIVDQINSNFDHVENSRTIFSDFDHDSLAEVFVFLKKDSSLFISGVEFSDTSNNLKWFTTKFVDHFCIRNNLDDFRILNSTPADITGDGFDEIIFTVLGFHARSIETDTGWKISLDRGLDIFQPYDFKNPFNLANNIQEERMLKAFEVTYLRDV